MATTTECAFCGEERELSLEHVWPRWLIRFIPNLDDKERRKRPIAYINEQGRRATMYRDEGPYGRPSKLPIVCKDCNNGWMSGLERAVQPILKPLAKESQLNISEGAQRTLAFWTAKTMMMLEYHVDGSRATTSAQRHWVFEHRETRELPPYCRVWMAPYKPQTRKLHRSYGHRSASVLDGPELARVAAEAPGRDNTQQTVFIIGKLLIVILSTTNAQFNDLAPPNFNEHLKRLRLIWPHSKELHWPTGQRINNSGYLALRDALDYVVPGPRAPWPAV